MQLNVSSSENPKYTPIGMTDNEILLGDIDSDYVVLGNPHYTTVEFIAEEGILPIHPLEIVGYPLIRKDTGETVIHYGTNYANLIRTNHEDWAPYNPPVFKFLTEADVNIEETTEVKRLEKIYEQIDIMLHTQISMFIYWYNKSMKFKQQQTVK